MTVADTGLLLRGRTVLPERVVDAGAVLVAGDRIAWVDEPGARPAPAAGTPVVDLPDHWIVPGFVDVHVHGGGGASYTTTDPDEALRAARLHREHGTTTTMASLVTGEIEDLCRNAAMLSELVEQGELAGVHFEGPFISAARAGAHDPALLRDPDPAVVGKLIDAARGTARMLTLAPELTGGLDAVRLLADRGVVAALGHTDAGYQQTREAIDAGVTVATHLFNAMPGLHHRNPGPIAALLEDERVTVELVGDGVHLHPAVVDLACRAAGRDRVAFVTDAMGAAGMGDGRYPLGPLTVRVRDGVARLEDGGSIAGSTLTLDVALKRAVQVNGMPVRAAVRALSGTPARLIGLDGEVGALAAGHLADLVVLDADFEVVAVMRRGRWLPGHAEKVAALAG